MKTEVKDGRNISWCPKEAVVKNEHTGALETSRRNNIIRDINCQLVVYS